MNPLDELLTLQSFKRIPKELYPTRVYQLLENLGFHPHNAKYIHITGSKGKGSLAYNTFNMLKQQHKVGLFTSPHILDFKERFVINDHKISEENLNSLIQQYKNHLIGLHFFEMCLFIALIYFLEENCEYIVLEVGVGGRFDPTNFCQPILSLLGNISMEHKELLGDTIEQIAFDKAGIIKPSVPALSVDQSPIVSKILQQEGEVLFFADIIRIDNYSHKKNYQQFDLHINISEKRITLPNIKLYRLGKAHMINFSLVVAGLFFVIPNFNKNWVYNSMEEKIPYRLDIIQQNMMIDSAHNGDSFENLFITLEQIKWNNIVLYVTLLQGKEIQDIAQKIIKFKNIIHHIEFFEFSTSSTKKSDAKKLYNIIKNDIPSVYHENIQNISLNNTHYQVFAGSFYSIPDVINLIKTQKV